MDLVHIEGPWTRCPCFVLSLQLSPRLLLGAFRIHDIKWESCYFLQLENLGQKLAECGILPIPTDAA